MMFGFFASPLLHAGYRVENVTLPEGLRGGIIGVNFTPTGTLVVTTRYGEIWMRRTDGQWRRFARGLNEPLGLIAESDRVVYVAHRPELLRASDNDGDGEAETFDALGGQWGLTNNYHAFFYGLKRDRDGNFYGAVSLESTSVDPKAPKTTTPAIARRGERQTSVVLDPTGHRSELPWSGWAVRITPEGKFEPWASGFRQANGIGMSPDGELFFAENQGDYKPSCGLLHVERGDFHGHIPSLRWEQGFNARTITTEEAWRRYKSPAVVFPHGVMGISNGEPIWDQSGGKFGPFAGQVFCGDYSAMVTRSSLEKVAGGWQGVVFPFLGRNDIPPHVTGEKLRAGAVRSAFAPDGSMYLGETGGWGGGADGLQRVVWDGRASPEVRDLKLTDRGFRITFTKPMSAATLANPANYEFNRFRFYYHYKYGSPWVDEARVAVTEARAAADGLSAELVLAELQAGFVYELAVPKLRTTENEPIANPLGYYTANRLHNGDRPVGGTTRLPRPDEQNLDAKQGVAATEVGSASAITAAGEKVYRMFCIACHQADGRGIPNGPANFVDDKSRLAKPDDQLLQIISAGNENKGMPPFGSSLTTGQRRAVLAYIRATFGGEASDPDRGK
jgi:mono/diheme cytochrome c family protein/glucose/arabinose dehydrogenase